MLISIDEFESLGLNRRNTNAERVVRFLVENRDKAYKAIEIAETTDVDRNSIHPVLSRLEERGLVRHKGSYWTVGDIEDVRDAMVFSSTAALLDETVGSESRKKWLRTSEGEET